MVSFIMDKPKDELRRDRMLVKSASDPQPNELLRDMPPADAKPAAGWPAAMAFLSPPPSSPSSPALRPKRPLTTRTPRRSSSSMTHSRLGLGRMEERQARVNALALAHFSSASAAGKVPKAMVLPAHCWLSVERVMEGTQ